MRLWEKAPCSVDQPVLPFPLCPETGLNATRFGGNRHSAVDCPPRRRSVRPRGASALPPQRFGSLAKFTASRRASSLVSSFAAERRPSSSSKYTYAIACPVLSRAIKHALFASSIVEGGGKRRGVTRASFRSGAAQSRTPRRPDRRSPERSLVSSVQAPAAATPTRPLADVRRVRLSPDSDGIVALRQMTFRATT